MPRLLLIGWDAADWSILTPLLDTGRLPNLDRLLQRGVMGNLASLQPCLTPMLWTSIATGCTADAHGVLGFVEPRPDGLGVIPCGRRNWRRKALWNILAEHGFRCSVVAWPVSHPAETGPGFFVSERLHDFAPGSVHPAHLETTVAGLRLSASELTPSDIAFLVRDPAAIHPQDPRPWQLAQLFAACATVHAAATSLAESEPWDFFAVYYETLDRAGHDFMQYRAPRMPHVSEPDAHHYGDVMNSFYEFHDAMLGRWMELAGPDTYLLLVSDHGFQTGAARPVQASHQGVIAAEGAEWHRMMGVFVLAGPGIKQDERVYGATLLDIAPTVLHLMGLPTAQDLPGRVLNGVLECPGPIGVIASWESPETAPAPLEVPRDGEAHAASLRSLVDLGYLAPEAIRGVEAAQLAEREALFNLASVHQHHGRNEQALDHIQRLCQLAPFTARYEISRLTVLSALSRHATVLEHVANLETHGYGHRAMHLFAAVALAGLGRDAEAEARFQAAVAADPGNAAVHQVLGDYHANRGRPDRAVASYQEAVVLDRDNARAHAGLAAAYLERNDYDSAAQSALASLQSVFFNPIAHFRLGQPEDAVNAFLHAVDQSPAFGEAHLRLSDLYLELGDGLRAAQHRQKALAS
ncbi:MAG: alkaline phosphatase family protein [Bryobacterales bacterium]|nr:alkaline phosphatase family protein [Bryobacterales bacterium]